MKSRAAAAVAAAVILTVISGLALATHARDREPQAMWGDGLEPSPEMTAWAQSRALEPGIHQTRIDGTVLILIALGQRPTSGHEVSVQEVSFLGAGRWEIEVDLSEPGPGEPVLQVITHPYDLVVIRGNQVSQVTVIDGASGEEWTPAVGQERPRDWSAGDDEPIGVQLQDVVSFDPEQVIWLEMRDGNTGELRYTYRQEKAREFLLEVMSGITLEEDDSWEDFVGWRFTVDLYHDDEEYLRATFAGESLTLTPISLKGGYSPGPSQGYTLSEDTGDRLVEFFTTLD